MVIDNSLYKRAYSEAITELKSCLFINIDEPVYTEELNKPKITFNKKTEKDDAIVFILKLKLLGRKLSSLNTNFSTKLFLNSLYHKIKLPPEYIIKYAADSDKLKKLSAFLLRDTLTFLEENNIFCEILKYENDWEKTLIKLLFTKDYLILNLSSICYQHYKIGYILSGDKENFFISKKALNKKLITKIKLGSKL